ncbi:hypothetical protein N9955_00825 [bacterium]|nr:hypothetical protein [bacterium]
MKSVYKFTVDRKIQSSKPVMIKDDEGNSVESEEKITKTIEYDVVLKKPTTGVLEDAEFFYGQKFNEYIGAGFYTKAMLSKKMGDIGGLSSKRSIEEISRAINDHIEASKTIAFYEASKDDLEDEQKDTLKKAKDVFAATKTIVLEYEEAMRSQFSQTADVKAEQRLIEWLVFNLSYYAEEIDGEKHFVPLFDGDDFDEKREMYLELCEDDFESNDSGLIKIKSIFDSSFNTLVRAATIWYNKMGTDQESIEKCLKDVFENEEGLLEEAQSEKPKSTAAKKKAKKKTPSVKKESAGDGEEQ